MTGPTRQELARSKREFLEIAFRAACRECEPQKETPQVQALSGALARAIYAEAHANDK